MSYLSEIHSANIARKARLGIFIPIPKGMYAGRVFHRVYDADGKIVRELIKRVAKESGYTVSVIKKSRAYKVVNWRYKVFALAIEMNIKQETIAKQFKVNRSTVSYGYSKVCQK